MQVLQVSQGLHDYYQTNNPNYSNIRIDHVNRLTEGWETVVFDFSLYYDKNNVSSEKRHIIRFYPGKDGDIRATQEFNLMASLMMTTVPVPDPYMLEVNNNVFDIPFVIMENISGKLLSIYILENSENKDALLENFTKIMVDLHQLEWKNLVHRAQDYAVSNPYQYIVETMNTFKDQIEIYDKKEFIPVLRWLVERMDTVPNNKLSLLHGDFHLANVIVDKNEEFHVIDWVKSRVGDFRVDLAWTLIVHETVIGKETRDIILNAYRSYASYEVTEIKYFEVLAILKQLLDLSINFEFKNEASRLNPNRVDKMKENLEPIKNSLAILYGHTRIKIPDFERMIR